MRIWFNEHVKKRFIRWKELSNSVERAACKSIEDAIKILNAMHHMSLAEGFIK